MPRALWNGSISFGLVNVPVTLLPGDRREELKFHLLDRRDRSPVHYVRVNEHTGEEVPWEEIVKGFEYEKDRYVVLSDEDFRSANVKATETIEILDFVRADDVDPRYFDTPYYLEPRKEGKKAYALLRETLLSQGHIGIATVVIRTRQHLAALIPQGDMLLLQLLRFAHELRDPGALDLPSGDLAELDVGEKELAVARQLVDAMVAEWDPQRYHDTYRDDLLALVREKAERGEGQPAPQAADATMEPGATGQVVDIMGLLKRSVEQARNDRDDARRVRSGKLGRGRKRAREKKGA